MKRGNGINCGGIFKTWEKRIVCGRETEIDCGVFVIRRRRPVGCGGEGVGVRGGVEENPATDLMAVGRGAEGERLRPEIGRVGLYDRVGHHFLLRGELDPYRYRPDDK